VSLEDQTAGSLLELWADPRVVRRSRAFALLLLVNWVGMGYFVLANGLRSLTGGLAFAFGILALVAALSQLRGARLSTRTPLVRLSEERVEFRPYSGAQHGSVALREVAGLEAGRDAIVLALHGGEKTLVPAQALSPSDRELLGRALREKLAGAAAPPSPRGA
jgi:hypothetical protein